MNFELFTAFLLITIVLIIAPGPIVTLIISTGVLQGRRAALITVRRDDARQRAPARGDRLRARLGARARRPPVQRAALDRRGLSHMARRSGVAACGRRRREADGDRPQAVPARDPGCAQQSEDHRLLHRLPAAVHRSAGCRPGPQLAAMCVATVVLAGLSDCAWAVAAGMGRAWFMKPKRAKLLGRLSGTVLIGGGLWLSLARRSS